MRFTVRACLPVVVLVCLTPFGEARTQDLGERIESALASEDKAALSSALRSDRLASKAVVAGFIRTSIEARLGRDAMRADRFAGFAATAARSYEQTFGERSLSIAVGYLDEWTLEDMSAKLEADSLYASGTELRGSGDTRDQATADYEHALELYRRIRDRIGEASVVGGLGYIAFFADRERYLPLNEEALALRREVDDRELIGNSLNDVALAYRLLGDNQTALEYYRESEAVRVEIGDSVALSRLLPNIGRVHEALGQFEEAARVYERAALISRNVEDHSREAVALRNAGAVLSDLGRLSDALVLFERALDARIMAGEPPTDILNHLGITQRRLGDFESALEYYQQVVDLAGEAGDDVELASALSNIGVVYISAERPDRSIRYFERARERFQSAEDAGGVLNATINLGSAFFEMRDYASADREMKEALRLSRELGDQIGETTTLVLAGNVLNRLGDFTTSIQRYEEALVRSIELDVPRLIFASTLGLGEVNERRGAYDEAILHYERAFEVLEGTRGRLTTDEEKAGFLAQQRYAYEEYIHMLTRLDAIQPEAGHAARAFEFAERAKARAFLDLLAEALANVQSGVDPDLLQRQDSLLQRVAALRNEIVLKRSAPDGAAATVAALEQALAETQSAYGSLERRIREANPRYADLQYPTPIGLREVQGSVLGKDVALLEYSLGDSSSTLWVITSEAAELIRLPPRNVITEQIEMLRFALSDPRSETAVFAGPSRRLHEMLVAPALSAIGNRSKLVIVPDDVLHYLPFEALISEDPSDEGSFATLRYIARRFEVSYAQSASVLSQLSASRPDREYAPARGLLAFGDPVFAAADGATTGGPPSSTAALERLPFTGDEVRAISALFEPGDADVFVREAATEERLKNARASGRYRYIHLATHGLVDERRPDFSAVILSRDADAKSDGVLQAAEVFNLRLDADLVVLSACETGLGRMVRGEGVVGLTRAFMYAGAPSVIVSLWRVADESTSRLMTHFYSIIVGESTETTTALRRAKVRMIEEDRYAHPFYWAPFVLSGDWK